MTTYASHVVTYRRYKEQAKTGGPWLKFHLWHSGMYYVRRSNKWPHLLDYPDPPSYKD